MADPAAHAGTGMTRALVLSGGGPLAIAWQSGLVAGFARGGVDLGVADYIQGTAAGAVVGARLAGGADASELAERHLAARPAAPPRAAAAVPPEAFAQMTALI